MARAESSTGGTLSSSAGQDKENRSVQALCPLVSRLRVAQSILSFTVEIWYSLEDFESVLLEKGNHFLVFPQV